MQVSQTPLHGHLKDELDSILKISTAQNIKGKSIDGFILLVYTGNSRNEANGIWGLLDTDFPKLNPKVSYRQPNFQVTAGKFTDRLEAYRTLQIIRKKFPKALMIPKKFRITYE